MFFLVLVFVVEEHFIQTEYLLDILHTVVMLMAGRFHECRDLFFRADLHAHILRIGIDVKAHDAIDDRFLRYRIHRKRMPIEYGDIRILADFNRADPVLNAQLDRRVDRNQRQCLVIRQAAVLLNRN